MTTTLITKNTTITTIAITTITTTEAQHKDVSFRAQRGICFLLQRPDFMPLSTTGTARRTPMNRIAKILLLAAILALHTQRAAGQAPTPQQPPPTEPMP